MPAPLVIAAAVAGGAQVLSSIAQLWNAEKQRGADGRRLAEIERLFNEIRPAGYDIDIIDPPELIMQSIPPTAFDMSDITPQAYAVAAKYIPEVASYIAEQNPQIVRMSAAGQMGRDAQIQALKDIRARTGEVSDAEAQDASAMAMRDAQINAQSRQESVLQDANRRGQLGSGAMLAAQLQGGSDQMERGANLSSQAYLEALRNKLGAIRSEGEMGRQLGNDEFSQSAINADIINKFNQRAATSMNAYNQNAAETINKGRLFNVQNEQNVANQNVGTANDFALKNRMRKDDLMSKNRSELIGEITRGNQVSQQNFGNKITSQNQRNQIESKILADKMDIAGAKAGIGWKGIGYGQQSAQDRNQAIQGFGTGIANTAMTAGYLATPNAKATATVPETQKPFNSDQDLYDTVPEGYKVRSKYY
jgi:hypothetical protein